MQRYKISANFLDIELTCMEIMFGGKPRAVLNTVIARGVCSICVQTFDISTCTWRVSATTPQLSPLSPPLAAAWYPTLSLVDEREELDTSFTFREVFWFAAPFELFFPRVRHIGYFLVYGGQFRLNLQPLYPKIIHRLFKISREDVFCAVNR